MATRTTPFAPGTPCWVDLTTSDGAAATSFYVDLFGWEAEDTGEKFGHYTNFRSDGHLVAGMPGQPPPEGHPDYWSTYISVRDAGATVEAITAAGGEILLPAMTVAELGGMAIARDPSGAVFGIWQPAGHNGFAKYNEPGSVTWDELHTKDLDAASAFYERVFSWQIEKMSETSEFRYSLGKMENEPVAGLFDASAFLPDQIPSNWAVYFSVADVDAALARVAELGGSVLRPAEDSPFGRVADAADVTGAAFKLHGPTLS